MLKLDGIVFYIVVMEGKREVETSPDKVAAVEKACQMANYTTVNGTHPTVMVAEVNVAEMPPAEPGTLPQGVTRRPFQTQAQTILVL